jgi:flagellar basal-body rod modification protein FlgD
MTAVSDLNSIIGATAPSATARKTSKNLGVDDFLRLMTTQLKNQDPLKPLDSTEFVAQLAQFGTVSGVQGMQTSLDTLSAAMRSSQMLNGASLVGHHVLTAATDASFDGTVLTGQVDIPAGSSNVQLNISDTSGQVVRHLSLPADAGKQTFQWNGVADNGATVAPGSYHVQVVAGSGSTNQSLATYIYGSVGSVTMSADGTGLTVNTPELGAVALSAVREII